MVVANTEPARCQLETAVFADRAPVIARANELEPIGVWVLNRYGFLGRNRVAAFARKDGQIGGLVGRVGLVAKLADPTRAEAQTVRSKGPWTVPATLRVKP